MTFIMISRFGRRGSFLAACVLILVLMTACTSYSDSSATPLLQSSSDESSAGSDHSLNHTMEQNNPPAQSGSPSKPSTPDAATTPIAPTETVEPTSLSILAVGDIITDSLQFPACLDKGTGTYAFPS